ncbi:uncharacterized protein [Littorina saxatilis]|uniref:uncharacterized protein n=1 Tax=Littorina saxatilis TaxID=31220 RepID=UPI0038B57BD1
MPTSASRTSLASNSELQHPPETSPPNGDDDPPISAMSPRAEGQQPLLPTAPDLPDGNDDDESNTSDVGTASDDQSINIGDDDNGSLNDIEININDTDSGVVAGEGRGSRSGSRSSSRSMLEPVHLPIQIRDGVNNYLLMTTVDSETDHSIGHGLDTSL